MSWCRTRGDDGVAVVSYNDGNPVVSNVTITRANVLGQKWGRAFSVVGGNAIIWRNIHAEYSSAASIYVSSESEWNTLPVTNVILDGATLDYANQTATVDHGAILLYNSQPSVNSDISLRNVCITNTRSSASRQVGIINTTGASTIRVSMENFAISGGPSTTLWSNGPTSAYRQIAMDPRRHRPARHDRVVAPTHPADRRAGLSLPNVSASLTVHCPPGTDGDPVGRDRRRLPCIRGEATVSADAVGDVDADPALEGSHQCHESEA